MRCSYTIKLSFYSILYARSRDKYENREKIAQAKNKYKILRVYKLYEICLFYLLKSSDIIILHVKCKFLYKN